MPRGRIPKGLSALANVVGIWVQSSSSRFKALQRSDERSLSVPFWSKTRLMEPSNRIASGGSISPVSCLAIALARSSQLGHTASAMAMRGRQFSANRPRKPSGIFGPAPRASPTGSETHTALTSCRGSRAARSGPPADRRARFWRMGNAFRDAALARRLGERPSWFARIPPARLRQGPKRDKGR